MRKICSITGMTLISASHFSNYFTRSLHPLLEVKTTKLLELAGTKPWMEWQEEEAKLLFLALANSLSLIEVSEEATAKPSPATIASSIEMLVAIAGWHCARNFPLPCFRIHSGNEDEDSNEAMLAFPQLLSTIIATREETAESDKIALEAIRLEEVIKILYSKCSIGANKHKMLRTKVADWAIKITREAAKKERVGEEITELWHRMLTTAPIDAHKFEQVDIKELDEFMCCNLPHGCTASYEVMKHLTAMKNATIELASFLGIDNVIQVINDEDSSIEEPREADYPTKLEFLIAKAKFQQAKSNRESASLATTIDIRSEVMPEEELPLETEEANEEEEEGDSNDFGI